MIRILRLSAQTPHFPFLKKSKQVAQWMPRSKLSKTRDEKSYWYLTYTHTNIHLHEYRALWFRTRSRFRAAGVKLVEIYPSIVINVFKSYKPHISEIPKFIDLLKTIQPNSWFIFAGGGEVDSARETNVWLRVPSRMDRRHLMGTGSREFAN